MSELPVTEEVNPLKLINPLSPFADLFVTIYNVTKPSSEWMKNYDPHMLGRDINKNGPESWPSSSSSPGSSYDEFRDVEREANKKRDLITHKLKEGDTRLEENFSGPLPLPFQCCNRLFKDSTALAMHQKSYTHKSYQMDRLDINEQMDMDQSPVRIEWLKRLMDFMADRGSPLMHCPTLPGSEIKRPEPLDLYKFYNLVQLYGLGRGSNNCSSKAWNDISELMGVSPENTHDLQRLYDRCLLPYEDADTPQNLQDVNFNSPSRVSRTILDGYSQDVEDNSMHWKRKNKKSKKFEKKQRLSVFKRLGKKKEY